MAKDYYLILGVPLDAAPDAIRSAFRKLALRYHPDRRGETGSRDFQDISEAYDVLSDPVRRARYDRGIGRPAPRDPFARAPRPASAREAEPLRAEPIGVTGAPDTVRPSFDALIDRLSRNFLEVEEPKADHAEPLDFELILSPHEAELGTLIPFEVPVLSICYQCAGTGRDWVFPCGDCGGEGRIVDREAVPVRVPAGIRDGSVIEHSLEGLGVRNLWLRVHVRVELH